MTLEVFLESLATQSNFSDAERVSRSSILYLDTIGTVGYLVGDDLDRESSVFISSPPCKKGPKNVILRKGQAISKRIEFPSLITQGDK